VRRDSLADALDDLLDRVPALAGTRTVTRLPGGLTNANYKVVTPGGAYVVRVPDATSALLAIDRDNEHHNSVAAAQAGVGAPVVGFLPGVSVLVLGFIEGETLTAQRLRHGIDLRRISAACRRLHGARPFARDFDMFEVQQRYLRLVVERGFRLPERYLDFGPQVAAMRAAMAVRPEPAVPCNNDLLAENFIDDGRDIRIIDYEYSGNNDPCFELGNIWSESALSLDQLELLVTSYYCARRRSRIARARLWGLMSKYGWTLWASIQAAVSPIDFDFWSWGMEKYERAVGEFAGPAFAGLLDDVARED
jgi:thiamine kinase-like enzyme